MAKQQMIWTREEWDQVCSVVKYCNTRYSYANQLRIHQMTGWQFVEGDCEVLARIPDVRSIEYVYELPSSWDHLQYFPNITSLQFRNLRLEDFDLPVDIQVPEQIVDVSFNGCSFVTEELLRRFINCKRYSLYGCRYSQYDRLTSILGLDQRSDIEQLHVHDAEIEHFNFRLPLPNLEDLSISHCGAKSISMLHTMESLARLGLDDDLDSRLSFDIDGGESAAESPYFANSREFVAQKLRGQLDDLSG